MNQKILKISLLVIGFILMVLLVTLAFIFTDDIKEADKDNILYKVSTIPLPEYIKTVRHSIYTPTNHIVFYYSDDKDNYHVGVMDDEGKNLHDIYDGGLPVPKDGNGIRLMPYADNKRILLGDYVIEAVPNLDDCDKNETKLYQVKYPDEFYNYKHFLKRWTEIIIAPDNIHIGWTSISIIGTAINFMGRLEKNSTGDGYNVNNITVISDVVFAEEVAGRPGILKSIEYIHGGEIKQFIDGGTKITLAGAVKQGMSRAVVQDLKSNVTYALSQEPGYEETAIVSPDGKLAMAMSTRFSPETNCAILGLLPRPDSIFTLMGMNRYAYAYSVTQVRTSRVGNVGPALFEVDKAIKDRNYHGFDLHDPSDNQNWVFLSPLSWHQSSTKAIWPEVHRTSRKNRIRKMELITDSSKTSYVPGKPIPAQDTPDVMPYSKPFSYIYNLPPLNFSGTFEGVNGGKFVYDRQKEYIRSNYTHYSTDGKVFADGFEYFEDNPSTDYIVYTGKVTLSGEDSGSMDFKLVFSKDTKLLKDQSYGYSTYGGRTIKVEDMSE